LTGEPGVLPSHGLPRGGCRKPVTRQGEAFERADTTSVVPSPRASGASQRFFVAAVPAELARAWSLKTQQRETSRPLVGVSLRADTNPSSFPLEDTSSGDLGRTGSVDQTCRPRAGDESLHGEFDPGSGRTLAARLTHASRARTWASARGTAANG
jgi:hypothetical protein